MRMDCIYKPICDWQDCPCGHMKLERITKFETKFKGTLQETVECKECGQIFHYPTYAPYEYCPYCGARKDDNG